MKISYLLIVFISSQALVFNAKSQDKPLKSKTDNTTRLASAVQKSGKSSTEDSLKESEFWEKEDLLPIDSYRPKKSPIELQRLLKIQLDKIESVCEAGKATLSLQEHINALHLFLKKELDEVNNMDIDNSIQFSSMLEILKDSSNPKISLESFTHKYRYMFNESGNVKFSEQAQDWAVSIERALKCAQSTNKEQ